MAETLERDQLHFALRAERPRPVRADFALPLVRHVGRAPAAADAFQQRDGLAGRIIEVIEPRIDRQQPADGRSLQRRPQRGGTIAVPQVEAVALEQVAGGIAAGADALRGAAGAIADQFQRELVAPIAVAPGVLQRHVGADIAVAVDIALEVDQLLGGRRTLQHHIGDHRASLHVDARRPAADQLDPRDTGGADPAQDLAQPIGLRRGRLAVDQHIARVAGDAARLAIAGIERKAGQALHHVQRGRQRGVAEKFRAIHEHAGSRGRAVRACGRIRLLLGLRGHRASQDGGRQYAPNSHRRPELSPRTSMIAGLCDKFGRRSATYANEKVLLSNFT